MFSHLFSHLLRERIVLLGSELTEERGNEICSALVLLAAQSPARDISLYINSPGGSVSAAMAVFDTMQYVRCDVSTVATGLARSTAQFLLTAGTKGKRYALPHAQIMMDQPSGAGSGSASDLAIQAEQLVLMKRRLAELNAAHTGQPVARIEADSERDRWFTPEQAQEYGLIDRVLSRAEVARPDPAE